MKKCKPCKPSAVKRYKAIYKPRCNGGTGCGPCWEKCWRVQRPDNLGTAGVLT